MKALITGITGQTGSYLAELLLEKNYQVFGMVRHTATANTKNIQHILPQINLVVGDLTDQASLDAIMESVKPDEVYNLGAMSFVKSSWDLPELSGNVNGIGVLRVLEAIRKHAPYAKFYQASTSEMFGKVRETPQTEKTPFHPRSPYGVGKLYGHWIAVNYRESYDMFNCCGILYNHESPRRGEMFVTQKIAKAAARIKTGLQNELVLGNLDAKRDIGHAKDYVNAMWLMLGVEKPDDYVIATGKTHSIREMLDVCFGYLDLDWRQYVKQSEEFMRPAEVDLLLGDASKAVAVLGWKPAYTFEQILTEMVDNQLECTQSHPH